MGRRVKNMKTKLKGQAVVEYVLLVAVMALVFSGLFSAMRQSVYRLWICEFAIRVQAPSGCKDARECREILSQAPGYIPAPYCPTN
jgi:Flp pilus assembly pilin Flp